MTDVTDPLPSPSALSSPAADITPDAIQHLVAGHGAVWVDEATLDAWMVGGGERVLLLAGDPVRFPDGLDLAVLLPEVQRALAGRFTIGVVHRSAEEAVARHFGSRRWPSLVFVRDGLHVSTLPGLPDWSDFVARVHEALVLPPARVPGLGIAVVNTQAGTAG
jgi:hydrogenase-1 operon protein HyaE